MLSRPRGLWASMRHPLRSGQSALFFWTQSSLVAFQSNLICMEFSQFLKIFSSSIDRQQMWFSRREHDQGLVPSTWSSSSSLFAREGCPRHCATLTGWIRR